MTTTSRQEIWAIIRYFHGQADPLPDRAARSSCDSPSSPPGVAAHRCEGTHTAAWSRQSLAFSLEVRDRPVGSYNIAVCSDPSSPTGTPVAGSAQSVRRPPEPPPSSPRALPVFGGDCLQRLDRQRLLRHHLRQLPVFLFPLAQLLHVADC